MCGIAGCVTTHPFPMADPLSRMAAALLHRGPDDHGSICWTADGRQAAQNEPAHVGLAHRRLSIIDLSSAGRQPMSNEDGSLWITCNGEFYNHRDFDSDLRSKGHTFRSRCDTETLLHLYEEQGIEKTLHAVNGMFSFALWDRRRDRLILARDRLGKKPLYYTLHPDGTLLFASECTALVASGRVDTSAFDPIAMAHFWSYGYIMGEHTAYAAIRRLLPGHYAVWEAGRLVVTEYWDRPFGTETIENRSLASLSEELESLLCDSIRLRMVSDVPIGVFLSGGVDSALVTALAARITARDIQAFTIAFSPASHDESPQASRIARHLGIRHSVLAMARHVDNSGSRAILRRFGEPFGDASAIPTHMVSGLARSHVTVALTGDAGDELFGGYDSYKEGLGLWGTPNQRHLFRTFVTPMPWVWDVKRRITPGSRRLTVWERRLGPRRLRKVLSRRFLSASDARRMFEARERWYPRVRGADLLSQMQYVNLKTYLPDDILVKVDRMSMAHALECRNPLLDHRIVDFASRLPYSAKIDEQGRGKHILRRVLSRYLPDALIESPKRGFGAPYRYWTDAAFIETLRHRWASLPHNMFDRDTDGFLIPEGLSDITDLQWFAHAMATFLEYVPSSPQHLEVAL